MPEERDVEHAVMRCPVIGAQSGPIHTKSCGKILQADIVHGAIIGALHEA